MKKDKDGQLWLLKIIIGSSNRLQLEGEFVV